MPETIKVVHTSAVHLGRRFPQLDSEAEKVRYRDVFRAFDQVVSYVIKNKAQLLLIAGDLFDRMRPAHETIEFVLSRFGEIHARSPETRIAICPGEEEVVVRAGGGVECSLSIFNHVDYVHVLGAGGGVDSVQLEWGGRRVRVSSCSFDHLVEEDFRFREVPACEREFGVFLTHCHSRRRGTAEAVEILEEKIFAPLFARGYRCFALGHPVGRSDLSTDDYAAVFPGSLERFDLEHDRDRKTFTAYEVGESAEPPKVSAVKVGTRPLEIVSITCTPDDNDVAGMVERMVGKGNREAMLYVVLDGQARFPVYHEFRNSDVLKRLGKDFAVVHVDTRLALLDEGEEYRFKALEVGSAEEEFKSYMKKEIAQAPPDSQEQAFLWELLEMGLREIGEEL